MIIIILKCLEVNTNYYLKQIIFYKFIITFVFKIILILIYLL